MTVILRRPLLRLGVSSATKNLLFGASASAGGKQILRLAQDDRMFVITNA